MNEERDILRQVRAAREDMGAADAFIRTYMPFIKAETAKFLRRPPVEGYVGGLGRFMHRTQTEADIHRLDLVIEEVERVISEKRKELSHDPLSVSPARIQDMIKQEIPEIEDVYSPSPIAVQLTGLRVKLAYEEYAQRVRDLVIEGDITVGDVADVLPSRMRNYILIRIRPLSETNIVV